jgi:hypothetical protein
MTALWDIVLWRPSASRMRNAVRTSFTGRLWRALDVLGSNRYAWPVDLAPDWARAQHRRAGSLLHVSVRVEKVRSADAPLRMALQTHIGTLGHERAGLTRPWELCFIDFERERIELTLRLPVENDVIGRIKALIDDGVRSACAAAERHEARFRERAAEAQGDDRELSRDAADVVSLLRGSDRSQD